MTAPYAAHNGLGGSQQSLASTYKSLIALNASSTTKLKRFKIIDLLIGTDGTPADNAIDWDMSAITAAGTATAVTPNPFDVADGACLTVANANYTAEPTVTANSSVFFIGVNQRASYRWVPAPGSEIVVPATNLAGYTLRAKSAGYTGNGTGQLTFLE